MFSLLKLLFGVIVLLFSFPSEIPVLLSTLLDMEDGWRGSLFFLFVVMHLICSLICLIPLLASDPRLYVIFC